MPAMASHQKTEACRKKATEGEVSSSHIRLEAPQQAGEEVKMSLGHSERGLQLSQSHCATLHFYPEKEQKKEENLTRHSVRCGWPQQQSSSAL
ncbi:hypothetical protein ATANTOWER_023906 [Ataeniobius toweri]|uniref:Uncharacterized protein n=1 Tax=Ataeniobius toweri TaxID=208326 RepID=A0ABU7BBM9_9TELE|nr:hypothetical protein [Ataeniobius toweri]